MHRICARPSFHLKCAQRSNTLLHGLMGIEVLKVKVFLFNLVQPNIRSVVELGLISVAGMALILQYVAGVMVRKGFARIWFLGQITVAPENSMGQQIQIATGTSRSGQAIEACRTNCIRPVGFFSLPSHGCITSKGKGTKK